MLHQARTTRSHSPIIVAATAAAQLNDAPHRIAAVKRYEVLDTPPEADFDRITGFAANLFDVPVSIIGFVFGGLWFSPLLFVKAWMAEGEGACLRRMTSLSATERMEW